MRLVWRRGVRSFRAILLTLVALALCPAFLTPAPGSPQDVRNAAALVASGHRGVVTVRQGGQFTRAVTKNGPSRLVFREGLPNFWGWCGGTIAINPSSMSAGELRMVRQAATDFAGTASGPWSITTTSATRGSGSVVVLTVDAGLEKKGQWAFAHFATSDGMDTSTPRFFVNISDATIYLSSVLVGESAALVRSVTLHELGHVAGADHNTSDPRAVMAPMRDPAHPGFPGYTSAEAAGIRTGGSRACG